MQQMHIGRGDEGNNAEDEEIDFEMEDGINVGSTHNMDILLLLLLLLCATSSG